MIEIREHHFVPMFQVVAKLPTIIPTQAIADEPLLWGAGWDFAKENGGPLTQMVMDSLAGEMETIRALEGKGRYPVIDTEGQHLLVGQFPSIPGWHCDSLPDANLDQASEDAVHYTFSASE